MRQYKTIWQNAAVERQCEAYCSNLAGDTLQHRYITPPPPKKACPQALSKFPIIIQIIIIIQPFFLAFNPVI